MSFSLTLSHLGVFVTDINRMVDFYTRFLGFAVSDRGPNPNGEIVFLTRDPREHHQIVLASGRPTDLPFNIINQISLRVDSLDTLRELYVGLKDEPVEILGPISHGNALSVYFRDPEKNRVELLIDTPWYVPQPHRFAVDIMQTEEKVWAAVEKEARGTPGFKSRKEWLADIEQKIARATADRKQPAHH